jgi:hypothetical protein
MHATNPKTACRHLSGNDAVATVAVAAPDDVRRRGALRAADAVIILNGLPLASVAEMRHP